MNILNCAATTQFDFRVLNPASAENVLRTLLRELLSQCRNNCLLGQDSLNRSTSTINFEGIGKRIDYTANTRAISELKHPLDKIVL